MLSWAGLSWKALLSSHFDIITITSHVCICVSCHSLKKYKCPPKQSVYAHSMMTMTRLRKLKLVCLNEYIQYFFPSGLVKLINSYIPCWFFSFFPVFFIEWDNSYLEEQRLLSQYSKHSFSKYIKTFRIYFLYFVVRRMVSVLGEFLYLNTSTRISGLCCIST